MNSCGNWLAVALKDAFRTEDYSVDLAAFKACLKKNGIEALKVDMDRVTAQSEDLDVCGLDAPASRGEAWVRGDRRKKLGAPGAKKPREGKPKTGAEINSFACY